MCESGASSDILLSRHDLCFPILPNKIEFTSLQDREREIKDLHEQRDVTLYMKYRQSYNFN